MGPSWLSSSVWKEVPDSSNPVAALISANASLICWVGDVLGSEIADGAPVFWSVGSGFSDIGIVVAMLAPGIDIVMEAGVIGAILIEVVSKKYLEYRDIGIVRDQDARVGTLLTHDDAIYLFR